jgi:hypothetical protein
MYRPHDIQTEHTDIEVDDPINELFEAEPREIANNSAWLLQNSDQPSNARSSDFMMSS